MLRSTIEWPSTARRRTNEPSSLRERAPPLFLLRVLRTLSLLLSHSHVTHGTAARSLLFMSAHVSVFFCSATATVIFPTEVLVHRWRRDRWSPHEVCRATNSCALHLCWLMVPHRRRLSSSTSPDQEYKWIYVGSEIHSNIFLFCYSFPILFCFRLQVDEHRGLSCINTPYRCSCSLTSVPLQCSLASPLGGSIHFHIGKRYKVHSIPTHPVLCKCHIIFIYLQVWAAKSQRHSR